MMTEEADSSLITVHRSRQMMKVVFCKTTVSLSTLTMQAADSSECMVQISKAIQSHIVKVTNINTAGWRGRDQQDATNLMFIIKLYLNMFRASLCLSSGEQECALPHMVFCTGSDGCGCVELGSVPAPHNHRHHYQCRTPYAAVHTLVLLMTGIIMPETCWDKSLIINIRLVASCWSLSLHPTFMMHGHKSLK